MKKISRGDFIANAAAGLLAVPAFGLFAAAPAARGPVKGTVRDTAGRGMTGVVVSDGLVCVRTDDAGRFTLPAAHDYARFVVVSTPTGAWFPTGAYWQPIVVDKTEGYDFVLKSRKETDARGGHRFIHFSDSEIGEINATEERWRDELKAFAASDGAAFIVHTGDICYHAGLVNHIKLMNAENMGIPVYYTVGNHDLVREGGYGEYLFESLYGPSCYSFNAGGVHYVVTPMRSGDARPSYTTERVAAWLKNDLALVPQRIPCRRRECRHRQLQLEGDLRQRPGERQTPLGNDGTALATSCLDRADRRRAHVSGVDGHRRDHRDGDRQDHS